MNTGLVMAGRADAGLMVCTPLPEMLNLIVAPVPALVCWMAARRVQLVEPSTVPSSQTPSVVSSSAPSPLELTVWVSAYEVSEYNSNASVSDAPAKDVMAAQASARP